MRVVDQGMLDAPCHDTLHACILGHLPGDRDTARRHASQAVFGEGVQREAGPEDEAVRPGLARGDAKSERVGTEAGTRNC
ncbi:hypothetical protein D9M72_534870 [compost metagenome]